MHNFTYANGKLQSVGGHDDMVMGCWICDQAIRQGGFSFTFDEGEKDGKSLDEYLKEQTAEPSMAPIESAPGEDGKEVGSTATGNLFDDDPQTSGLPLQPFFRDM
jgi:hypothetical protein